MIPRQVTRPPVHVGGVRRAETPVAVISGPDQLVTYAAPALTRWLDGRDPVGVPAAEVLAGLIGVTGLAAVLADVRSTGRPYRTTHDLRAEFDLDGDGTTRAVYFSVMLSPLPDRPESAVLMVAADITEHVMARRAQQLLAAREQLLLRMSTAATLTLSRESKLAALAEAAVPTLSDICAVYLLDRPLPAGETPSGPIGSLRITAPTTPGVIGPTPGRRALWSGVDNPAGAAVAAGRTVVVGYTPDSPPPWARAAGVDGAIREGRVHSTAMVPVIIDGQVHAVVAFGAGPDRPPYGEDHVELFGLVAALTATAMSQGSSYDDVRATSLILQRAMLTPPPTVPGIELAVRYRPAGESNEVGGDWYDVFRHGDGSCAVVVGDVAGHDVDAAAVMGQLRNMLRGFAVHDAGTPAETLAAVDHVTRHLGLTTLATCVCMSVRVDAAGLAVTWSNAGHPAPVVLDTAGTTTSLDDPRDAALGIEAGRPRTSAARHVPRGSTLLLFSDGLFERRGLDLDDALDELLAEIAAGSATDLEELCDRLLEFAPHDDDVVLVALRRH